MAGRDYRSVLSSSEFEEAKEFEKYIRTTMKGIRGKFDKQTAKRVENTIVEYKWNYLAAESLRKRHEAKRVIALELLKKYRNAPTDAEGRKYLNQYQSYKQELDALAKDYSYYSAIYAKMDSEARRCSALFVEKCKEAKIGEEFLSFMNKPLK